MGRSTVIIESYACSVFDRVNEVTLGGEISWANTLYMYIVDKLIIALIINIYARS